MTSAHLSRLCFHPLTPRSRKVAQMRRFAFFLALFAAVPAVGNAQPNWEVYPGSTEIHCTTRNHTNTAGGVVTGFKCYSEALIVDRTSAALYACNATAQVEYYRNNIFSPLSGGGSCHLVFKPSLPPNSNLSFSFAANRRPNSPWNPPKGETVYFDGNAYWVAQNNPWQTIACITLTSIAKDCFPVTLPPDRP